MVRSHAWFYLPPALTSSWGADKWVPGGDVGSSDYVDDPRGARAQTHVLFPPIGLPRCGSSALERVFAGPGSSPD